MPIIEGSVGFPLINAGAPSNGVNEVQTLTLSAAPASGTFRVAFQGQRTAALAHNVSAADMQTALRGLSTIGALGVTVGLVGQVYTVTFGGGNMAKLAQPLLTIESNTVKDAGDAAVTITPAESVAGVSATYRGAVKGALLVDTTNGTLYINAGTALEPAWTLVANLTGLTAAVAELNLLDGATPGTAVASKAVALGADKDLDELHLTALHLGAGAGTLVTPTAAQLNSLVQFPGQLALAVLRIPANVADEETISIGADVYEFDRAGDGVVNAGAIAVTGHADDTPAQATPALVAAINASGTEPVVAVSIDANEILIIADAVGNVTLALAHTMVGVGNEWDTAAMREGSAAGMGRVVRASRVPNAVEVIRNNLHFPIGFTPSAVMVQVRETATGALKAWDGRVVIEALPVPRVVLVNTGGTDWSAADTVTIVALT
jgi:hypothetical protein